MTPTISTAEFPEIVLELTVTSPPARMLPPTNAEFPEIVLELTNTSPLALTPPANDAEFSEIATDSIDKSFPRVNRTAFADVTTRQRQTADRDGTVGNRPAIVNLENPAALTVVFCWSRITPRRIDD